MKKFTSWVAALLVSIILPFSSLGIIQAEGDNLVANPSFEDSADSQPSNWTFNAWGGTTASPTYSDSGRTGTRSARIDVTAYTGGDAKWIHDFVAVTPGQNYDVNVYYRSDVSTELDAAVQMADGSTQYVYLGTVPAATDWALASFQFSTPADSASLSVFHVIYSVGFLEIDDMSIILSAAAPDPDPEPDPDPTPDPDPAPTPDPDPVPEPDPVPSGAIQNPSFEDGINAPDFWTFNSWGTNTASGSYESTGHSGSRSARVSVSDFVSGDAKWYSNPIAVSQDSAYVISNYYKATAPSEFVLQNSFADGTVTYQWLGTNPVAADWTFKGYNFVVPQDVESIRIFHVMAGNGELWTDSFALTEDIPTPPPAGLIGNGSVETPDPADPSQPADWFTNAWGSNSAAFEYLDTGYDGSRSIKTTLTSYSSGDAKWFNAPVSLAPGTSYQFSDYYQSNVDSRVVLAFNMQDGSVQYQELSVAGPSAGWSQFSGAFTMPAGAESVSVFHLISAVGFLITDAYGFSEYDPVPFSRALITLTFDDGWEDNISTAMPMMDAYGFKSTQFYATTFIQDSDIANAEDIIRSIDASGHEVNSHTITHPDLTTLNATQLQRELAQSQSYLESILGRPVRYFATPYGAYNTNVKNQIMTYYDVHRTVDTGFNSRDNFDISRLKVQNILNTTTAAEVNAWVQQAIDDGTWLILVYHRVGDNPDSYETSPPMFAEHLQGIDASGIAVVTMTQALSELLPQL